MRLGDLVVDVFLLTNGVIFASVIGCFLLWMSDFMRRSLGGFGLFQSLMLAYGVRLCRIEMPGWVLATIVISLTVFAAAAYGELLNLMKRSHADPWARDRKRYRGLPEPGRE